jgi:tRNA(fMet)-specific endonuclease VapC
VRILDTDHCVALLRGRLDLRGRAAPAEDLATTAVTVGELVYGAWNSARPAENLARLDVLLTHLPLLPFDGWAARRFGELRSQLERAGRRVDHLDLQIAAIALERSAPLVTHNRRHFDRVPGLSLEDWLEGNA